ncbi:MAG: SDR family oxidoreductase [Candidatus Rokubacteria bacterium]|nr:SDR family oxidoreductase [Candidatus Rokubacteria bacterium]
MPSHTLRQGNKRAALVTGGAVRVGRAIAIALAGAGMDVAIGYHRSAREARRTVRTLEAKGVRAVAVRANLADPVAARRLVERATAAFGRLDVLVNNAAVFRRTPFLAVTAKTYDEFLDVNLRGAFFCAQAAARAMGRRGGHIVNVGDAAIARPLPALLPYAIGKAGLAALTAGLAAALSPRGIAVNAVAPGPVLRPRGYPLARWRKVTGDRVVDVADVAAAVVFLATCPPGITGQTIAVDGRDG